MCRTTLAAAIVGSGIVGAGLGPAWEGTRSSPVAELHFDSVRGGMPFFAATVNRSAPLQFLVDTGGAGEHVDRGIADRLGMELHRGTASVSGSASLEVAVVPRATIAIGAARHEGMLIASPLATIEPILGRRFEGIIGGAFLEHHVLELDYDQEIMRLYEPKPFAYAGGGQSLPLSFVQGIPFVTLVLALANGTSIKGEFLVDTAGGGMAVHVYRQLADRDGLLRGSPTLAETGHGLGGQTSRRVARAMTLSSGPYRLSNPFVAVTDDTAGLRTNPNSVGLVGMEVLARFNLTFDYSRAVLHLKPNRRFSAPFVYDATGLDLRASPPSFSPPHINAVRDASPAKEAGLESNDIIVQIDGRDTSRLNLDRVRAMLGEPGKSHELAVSRNKKIVRVTLKTRDLL